MKNFEPLSSQEGYKLFEPSRAREWLQPSDLKELKKVIKDEGDTVILRGIKYTITYGFVRVYPVSKERVESVRLTRADGGFVPMGYIPLKKIMQA